MMTDLLALWLPILVSAVAVFFASFVFWAATPWHHKDVKVVPDPERADAAIASLGLPPGFYMLPNTHDKAEMRSEAFAERVRRGPWATINVFPGRPNMGRNLALSFLTILLTSIGVAYLAAVALPPGADGPKVFQVTCTAAVLAYAFGGMLNAIWFGKPVGWIVRDLVDALVFALITAACFVLMWPDAPAGIPGV